MDIELLGKLARRPVALDGCECHLSFECRCVVPARSSRHRSLLIRRPQRARRQAETPLIVLCRFPRPALVLSSRNLIKSSMDITDSLEGLAIAASWNS